MPDPSTWDYTFDHLANVIDAALQGIGFTGSMGVYMQDYGGPIGNRLIASHPGWLAWQVIQNANTYEEGFTEVWDGLRHTLWVNRGPRPRFPWKHFWSTTRSRLFIPLVTVILKLLAPTTGIWTCSA